MAVDSDKVSKEADVQSALEPTETIVEATTSAAVVTNPSTTETSEPLIKKDKGKSKAVAERDSDTDSISESVSPRKLFVFSWFYNFLLRGIFRRFRSLFYREKPKSD